MCRNPSGAVYSTCALLGRIAVAPVGLQREELNHEIMEGMAQVR
jgi:hypothetical protein